MNVAVIMNASPVTVTPSTPVHEVARLMAQHQVPGVLVVEPNGRLVGMISEEDLIMRNANLHLPTFLNILDGFFPVRGQHTYHEEVRHMLATEAREVMGERLFTIAPDADVSDAATLMVEHHVDPLAVVQAGRPVGTISRRDIVRLMVRQDESAAGTEDSAR